MNMSSSRTSLSSSNYTNSKQRKHFSVERRPRMLKDFLADDLLSCSSSGFKSFPRRDEDRSMRNLIQIDLDMTRNNTYSSTKRLLRSRSRAAASTTISAFQAIINTVKSIQFKAAKSPSILPRSLSRRLSKQRNTQNKSTDNEENEIKITVRIKDIVRWKSFRDLVEENPQPSDLTLSYDHRCATITTGSTNSSCSNSNCSSWCDSDFTSEDLPSWCDNSQDYLPGVGSDSIKATTEAAANSVVGPKEEELSCDDEKEQRSPVSVLDFQFEDDEESLPTFNKNLDHMEKLIQTIRCSEGLAKIDPFNLENWMSMEENNNGSDEEGDEEKEINLVEEKAMLLLNHVNATSSLGSSEDNVVEHCVTIDWEEYVRGIDRKFGKWNKFEEEQEEMALQIETGILNLLVDEVLADLILC